MLDFLPTLLLERDQEEALRLARRQLTFPDGFIRQVETYRLVWTWFDHLIAYDFAPEEATLLKLTLACAEEEAIEIPEAMARVVEHVLVETERNVGDVTDDCLPRLVAQRRRAAWRERHR